MKTIGLPDDHMLISNAIQIKTYIVNDIVEILNSFDEFSRNKIIFVNFFSIVSEK